MKLNIGERYKVAQLLPVKSNFETMKILRDLKSELSPSEEESKKCNIRMVAEKGQEFIKWDDEEYQKEIKFGGVASGLIVTKLMEMEKNEEIEDGHISIYEKFVKAKK